MIYSYSQERRSLTGLEVERSVLGDDPSRTRIYSYPQERRSPGWRWKDLSRTWEYQCSR